MATEWECMECGYLFEGERPPRRCPDCGANGSWEQVEYIDDMDNEDWDDNSEDE